jgi:nucleotide-binding universal stress UspA family protein
MKVLLAIDDSPYSLEVVDAAAKRAWPEFTQFKLLTVVEPLYNCGDEFDNFEEAITFNREKAADKFCKSVRNRLEKAVPGASIHYEIRKGVPKEEIIDAAIDWSADLILMGAHGQRGCPFNLLGSVSRTVLNHSPCSIEIVRAKQTQDGRKNRRNKKEALSLSTRES